MLQPTFSVIDGKTWTQHCAEGVHPGGMNLLWLVNLLTEGGASFWRMLVTALLGSEGSHLKAIFSEGTEDVASTGMIFTVCNGKSLQLWT